jgi:hypothetical protein
LAPILTQLEHSPQFGANLFTLNLIANIPHRKAITLIQMKWIFGTLLFCIVFGVFIWKKTRKRLKKIVPKTTLPRTGVGTGSIASPHLFAWETSKESTHDLSLKNTGYYEIHLFKCSWNPSKLKFFMVRPGIFCISSNPLENSKILMPITRKILNKYRDLFDKRTNVMMHQQYVNRPLFSWLGSELEILSACGQLLDELVKFSAFFPNKPTLQIRIGEKLTVGAIWESKEIYKFAAQFKESHPLVQLHVTTDNFEISLVIGTNEKNIHLLDPKFLFELEPLDTENDHPEWVNRAAS